MATRLNGVQQGEVNCRKLSQYLRSLSETSGLLPSRGGRPNFAAIARAAGINRDVLYTNKKCSDLLSAFSVEDRARQLRAIDHARVGRSENEHGSKKERELAEKVLRLEAEIASLKHELSRYRVMESIAKRTGNLPS